MRPLSVNVASDLEKAAVSERLQKMTEEVKMKKYLFLQRVDPGTNNFMTAMR